MEAHDFMRKFDHDSYSIPLYDMLDARFVNVMGLDGMEFILLDYYVKEDKYATNWYIFFREIVNNKVLEPAYTIITDNLYDGIDRFSYKSLSPFIGDRMRLIRKIPQSGDHKTHYYLEYLETFDYSTDTFFNPRIR